MGPALLILKLPYAVLESSMQKQISKSFVNNRGVSQGFRTLERFIADQCQCILPPSITAHFLWQNRSENKKPSLTKTYWSIGLFTSSALSSCTAWNVHASSHGLYILQIHKADSVFPGSTFGRQQLLCWCQTEVSLEFRQNEGKPDFFTIYTRNIQSVLLLQEWNVTRNVEYTFLRSHNVVICHFPHFPGA